MVEFASKKLIRAVTNPEDEDTLSLRNIKILYCWAIDMESWPLITSEIDKTWANLIHHDAYARKLVRKNGLENDPDTICIDKHMLKKMLDSSELFQSIYTIFEYHCFKGKFI